jgi:hypothetical protein
MDSRMIPAIAIIVLVICTLEATRWSVNGWTGIFMSYSPMSTIHTRRINDYANMAEKFQDAKGIL